MTRERDLLEKVISGDNKGDFFVSYDLYKEIYEFLAQPEEEGVYQNLLRIEDGVEVEILPSELWQDGYEAGKRSVLLSKQPEQHGTQYLLDQVARLTAENAMLKEKWSTSKQPEQEPVAWMQDSIELYVLEEKSAIRGYVIPLYTAPPKREPLTPQQISEGNQ